LFAPCITISKLTFHAISYQGKGMSHDLSSFFVRMSTISYQCIAWTKAKSSKHSTSGKDYLNYWFSAARCIVGCISTFDVRSGRWSTVVSQFSLARTVVIGLAVEYCTVLCCSATGALLNTVRYVCLRFFASRRTVEHLQTRCNVGARD
jgi:hypothetical protein